jgi:putative spermidine/putrescine transport system substrate-binding protein/spermidine/putrescine transport system substrate-binding protein
MPPPGRKGFARSEVSRRSLLWGAAAGLAACDGDRPGGVGEKRLRVLSWEGYTDPPWVAAFERKAGCKVDLTYVYSVDEISAKMAASGGSDHDVLCIESSSYRRLVAQRLVKPLPVARLPVERLLEVFQRLPGLSFDGQTFAVPYSWGSVPLIYARRAFQTPPTSWSVLWDPRFQSRVISEDDANNNIVTMALALGCADPFRLSDSQFARIKAQLLAVKRNLLTYFTGFDEGASIFAQGGLDLMAAMAEPQLEMVRARGVEAGLVIPREGAIGWVDCWAVSAGVRDMDLALAWISHFTSPDVGRYLSRNRHYGNTCDADANAAIGLDYAERLTFLQAPESFARRATLWNEVKASVVI